ncbi:MAG: hypothetical protein EBU84_12615 [Actinobacteria bacterium]|nr:hypothetical protein [Actinomycetota bacterium]
MEKSLLNRERDLERAIDDLTVCLNEARHEVKTLKEILSLLRQRMVGRSGAEASMDEIRAMPYDLERMKQGHARREEELLTRIEDLKISVARASERHHRYRKKVKKR